LLNYTTVVWIWFISLPLLLWWVGRSSEWVLTNKKNVVIVFM
jgi:hypothetical protein